MSYFDFVLNWTWSLKSGATFAAFCLTVLWAFRTLM